MSREYCFKLHLEEISIAGKKKELGQCLRTSELREKNLIFATTVHTELFEFEILIGSNI